MALRICYFLAVAFLAGTSFIAEARAGCPALPPEPVKAEILSCRFYQAAEDEALQKKVAAHFEEFMSNEPEEENAKRKANIYEHNTGAILQAVLTPLPGESVGETYLFPQGADNAAEEGENRAAPTLTTALFYRSSDPEVCAQWGTGQSYEFAIELTCAMIYFQAPVDKVISKNPWQHSYTVPHEERIETTREHKALAPQSFKSYGSRTSDHLM